MYYADDVANPCRWILSDFFAIYFNEGEVKGKVTRMKMVMLSRSIYTYNLENE